MRILVFIYILFIGCKQYNNLKENQIKDGSSYECVLIAPNVTSLKCGILKVTVAMKFKIKDGNGDLIILIQCPEMYGESFFSKDQEYRIKLTSDTNYCKGCTVINQYEKLDLPSYHAIEISKIN